MCLIHTLNQCFDLLNWACESCNEAKDLEEFIIQSFSYQPSIFKIRQNNKILKKKIISHQ